MLVQIKFALYFEIIHSGIFQQRGCETTVRLLQVSDSVGRISQLHNRRGLREGNIFHQNYGLIQADGRENE